MTVRIRRISLVAGTLLCACLLFGRGTWGDIAEDGPRPLNEALQQIEEHFNQPVFYEEIPHVNLHDLFRGSELGMNPHAYYLRSQNLNVAIAQPATLESSIRDTLAAYRSQGLPGNYQLTYFGNVPAVLPESMKNRAGSYITANPILNTPITLPAAPRTRIETLEAILDAMSVASRITINHLPLGTDYKAIVFQSNNEPGGSVLSRLEEELGPFSCHLLYDPATQQYFANLHWIAAEPVAAN